MKNWKLQNRVLLLALFPGLIISLILGSYFIFQYTGGLHQRLQQEGLFISQRVNHALVNFIKHKNPQGIKELSQDILNQDSVRALSIDIPAQGRQTLAISIYRGPKMLATPFGSVALLENVHQVAHSEKSIRIKRPIIASDGVQQFGWLEIELSTVDTYIQQYQYFTASIIVILLTLTASILLAIKLSQKLTQPVETILRTISDIDQGNYNSRAIVSDNLEFTSIAKGINSIANALERARADSEQSIEQATQDMRETLDSIEIKNIELDIARKQALEGSRVKSEFLANISHEIRTPLNGILGFTKLLKGSHIDGRQMDYLEIIEKSSMNLMTIINSILDLSKIDAGKLELEKIDFNLRELVEETLKIQAPEAHKKSLELTSLIFADVPMDLIGDPLRIKQILINFISNAIKFTETGSVTVRIHLVENIDEQENQISLQFDVSDTGIGMTEEQQKTLFKEFSQADSSISRKYGGTGLGLVISQHLVDAMRGEIQVESEPERGSTFSFILTLPLANKQPRALPDLDNFRVVFFEPSSIPRLSISHLLSQWKIECLDFSQQTEFLVALDNAPENSIDAIMLGLSNDDITKHHYIFLLEKLKHYNLPIIALANTAHNSQLDAVQSAGTDICLSKPVEHLKLYSALHKVLKNQPAEFELDHQKRSHNVMPTIVAVDDNDANLKLVLAFLEQLNISALGASSGQEAIDLVAQYQVDLIFMDIQMPIMNGIDATRIIRQQHDKQQLPIVALTAHAIADEKEELLNSGMNDYITKPISIHQLKHCIEQWTGYRASEVLAQHFSADKQPAQSRPTRIVNNTSLTDRRQISGDSSRNIFNSEKALHAANYKLDLAQEMFTMLLESLAKDQLVLAEVWQQQDLLQLLEVVHRCHGATKYCGTPELSQALADCENALKKQQEDKYDDLFSALMQAINQLNEWAENNDWRTILNKAQQAR